jgi:hypothetical protein
MADDDDAQKRAKAKVIILAGKASKRLKNHDIFIITLMQLLVSLSLRRL